MSEPSRSPSDSPPARPLARPASSAVRWRILAILFASGFVAYVLRSNLSIAGEAMMDDLGLSTVQLGIVLSAFAWAYAIFQIPGGVIGDRVGPRRSLTLLILAWGAVTFLTGLVPSTAAIGTTGVIVALVVLRGAMGVAQAPLFPISIGGAVRTWFPVTGWALPNGLITTGLSFGAAATGPLVAWLMETLGWRMSFILTSPLALIVAAAWWWYSRDDPAEHPAVSEAELALIAVNRPPSKNEGPGAWKKVLVNREVLLLTASYFCMNYVYYIFFNWFFVYLVDVRGFSALQGGWMAAAPWMVGAVGATAGGLASDAITRRWGIRWGPRVVGAGSMVLCAVLLFAGAAAPDPYVAVALMSLCFGFVQMTDAPYWAATMAVGGEHSAAATGVLNTGANVVGGIGALVVPLTAEAFGWVPALGTGSVFALIAAGLWLVIRADRPME